MLHQILSPNTHPPQLLLHLARCPEKVEKNRGLQRSLGPPKLGLNPKEKRNIAFSGMREGLGGEQGVEVGGGVFHSSIHKDTF